MPLTPAEADTLLEELRDLLNRFTEQDPTQVPPAPLPTPTSLAGYAVVGQEVLPDGFAYRWPNRSAATEYQANRIPTAQYRLRTEAGEYSLVIGEEKGGRTTHGRSGRGRIVVFVRHGSGMYPLVEFAEADETAADGSVLYAAGVPRPEAPRSLATADHLPALRESVPHLKEADIRRADEVYAGMGSGPTMRLIVGVTDVEAMLVHAVWVGQLRGGGRLPRPA
jgi:hypothetical protein